MTVPLTQAVKGFFAFCAMRAGKKLVENFGMGLTSSPLIDGDGVD
jgi:hypothetical protein